MTSYVALLRAVNVGGRKLLMEDLKRMAGELGLGEARTYIASGNLLFTSDAGEEALRRMLEERLGEHLGKPVGVLIRTAEQMARAVAANPFTVQAGNRVMVLFLHEKPGADAIETARNVTDERLAPGEREIYVHYPGGLGRSKLQIAAAATGTMRNMNTVAKLAELAKEKA